MIYGIILCGGYSSRMKTNKMLLKWHDDYLINHTIRQLSYHVDEVIVVTGHYHEDIVQAISKFDRIQIVRNELYSQGMFSSVKTGVALVDGDFFIVPGDYPLITPDVYQLLLLGSKEIRVPTYHGYKGHPIFLKHHLKDSLLAFDDSSSLKAFRDSKEVSYIETSCEGVTKDIDTIDDYKMILEGND